MAGRLQDVILRGTAALKPLATTVAPGTLYFSTDTNVTERCSDATPQVWESYSGSGGGGATTPNNGLCQGRLTTETGIAISTADRTAQSTLYFTPYLGNRIALYNGTAWVEFALTERSLALSGLTSGKNYDVFLYDNAGTLTLELSSGWATDTTRTDAIILQNGVWVKSGALTRRYVGTIRTTGTTTIEDSLANRYVWNASNQVTRLMKKDVVQHTYATATWRIANADTANAMRFVIGLAGQSVVVAGSFAVTAGIGGGSAYFGIAHNAADPAANLIIQTNTVATLYYSGGDVVQSVLGFNELTLVEYISVGTATYLQQGRASTDM